MTTVCWDGRTLAADRRVNYGGTISTTTKIRRLSDGRLVGAAGYTTACLIWMDWLENGGERPAVLSGEESGINGIEIKPNGEIWEHSRYGSHRNEETFSASGSGVQFAIGAMAQGANAVRAVEIASMFDPGTGNGIDTLTLDAA